MLFSLWLRDANQEGELGLRKATLTAVRPERKWIAIALLAAIVGCAAPESETTDDDDIIVDGDRLFKVFELTNSAGDGTFSSSEGTVYLSFVTRDSRYCRAARIHKDSTAVLACRNEARVAD